jgi:hypothetical protein
MPEVTDVVRSLSPKKYQIYIKFYGIFNSPVRLIDVNEWTMEEKGELGEAKWTDIKVQRGPIQSLYRYRTNKIKSIAVTEVTEY